MKAQADTEAALAARNAARAELERFEAERRSALAVQNGTDNAIIRAAQDRQQLALKQQLTAAETIYQQKLKALPTALGSFSSSLAGVGRMAKTAGSALLGAFGGPVGLAVTALTAGLGYLATQEDAATKFSREHADALMLVSDNTGTAASALDAYREQLKGMTAERLKFEQASVSANLQHVAGGDMLNGSAYKNIMSEVVPMALFDGNAPAMREQLREAMASLLPTNIANATLAELEAVKQKLMELGVQYNRTGETSSAITKFLDPLIALKIQQEAVTAQAGNVASGLDGIGGSASAAASGVNSLVVELGKLNPKRLANVMSSLEFKSYAKELKGVEKFKAEQLNAAGLSAEAVRGRHVREQEAADAGYFQAAVFSRAGLYASEKNKGRRIKSGVGKDVFAGRGSGNRRTAQQWRGSLRREARQKARRNRQARQGRRAVASAS